MSMVAAPREPEVAEDGTSTLLALPPPTRVPLPEKKKAEWKHGVIDFEYTGRQAKFLLVPRECEDAAEVLQMLSQRHLDLRQAKREKYRSWFQ